MFSGFDLFEVPPTNTFILQSEDEGVVEWSLSGIGAVYIDFANSYIEFTVKVAKQYEADLPADAADVCGIVTT